MTVRVLHHIKNLTIAFRELARITAPGGCYVTECASKRNLKAVLRYLARRGKPNENPFSLDPFEFVALNIDYHPRHVMSALKEVGFMPQKERGVSFFRLPLLKRVVPTGLLVAADGVLQQVAAPLRLTPSIFLKSRRVGE